MLFVVGVCGASTKSIMSTVGVGSGWRGVGKKDPAAWIRHVTDRIHDRQPVTVGSFAQQYPKYVGRPFNSQSMDFQTRNTNSLTTTEGLLSPYNDPSQPSEDPAEMEFRALSRKQIVMTKIFRFQGLFLDAEASLTGFLLLPRDTNRIQVLCSLADVYCDLGSPGRVYSLVVPEIKINQTRRGKAFRRLSVSEIDAFLGQLFSATYPTWTQVTSYYMCEPL